MSQWQCKRRVCMQLFDDSVRPFPRMLTGFLPPHHVNPLKPLYHKRKTGQNLSNVVIMKVLVFKRYIIYERWFLWH